MVVLGGKADSLAEAESLLRDKLASGEALDKFRTLVAAQGGNPDVADDPSLLPQAPVVIPVIAEQDGYVQRIDAEQLGIAAMVLGAGRATKDAVIDYAVGLTLRLKVGDPVRIGDTLVLVHAQSEGDNVSEVAARILQAYTISEQESSASPLLLSVVTAEGVKRLV